MAAMQSPRDNIPTLEQLIFGRHALASMLGFGSFARYTAAGATLAGTPAAVQTFLDGLSSELAPQVSPLSRQRSTTCDIKDSLRFCVVCTTPAGRRKEQIPLRGCQRVSDLDPLGQARVMHVGRDCHSSIVQIMQRSTDYPSAWHDLSSYTAAYVACRPTRACRCCGSAKPSTYSDEQLTRSRLRPGIRNFMQPWSRRALTAEAYLLRIWCHWE